MWQKWCENYGREKGIVIRELRSNDLLPSYKKKIIVATVGAIHWVSWVGSDRRARLGG